MALRSGRVGIHPSQVDPITGMLLNSPTPGSMSFEDLSDAQISNPEVGQTLIYNGTGWENETPSVTPTTLSALQDVQITDPEDGSYLVYDAENNKWINSVTPPAPVVPEGSTVTPTDDIQTWLACAGITDKTYTTLNEVLADSTTLLALMSDNNAVDYLVRSTSWASGVCANSTAMTDIGANNYCANTLLDDATWCSAICNSTYFESVLNVKVPTMTSNTTPSGECIWNSSYGDYNNDDNYKTYRAFDDTDKFWLSQGAVSDQYMGYDFQESVKVCKVYIKNSNGSGNNPYYASAFSVKGSNDKSTWTEVGSGTITQTANSDATISFTNNTGYRYYAIFPTPTYGYIGLNTVQFYGR